MVEVTDWRTGKTFKVTVMEGPYWCPHRDCWIIQFDGGTGYATSDTPKGPWEDGEY